jgi:hypothetical protein
MTNNERNPNPEIPNDVTDAREQGSSAFVLLSFPPFGIIAHFLRLLIPFLLPQPDLRGLLAGTFITL